MQIHRFVKEPGGWYIDLPQFLEQGLGTKSDLAMVAGADTLLDLLAEGADTVVVAMADQSFEGADKLELLSLCDPQTGGGNYLLRYFEGRSINQGMWLCAVTQYVFGVMPPVIYIRRESL
jgi:hypothetical protein